MASGAAERRKIRQLEADLEDAETAKKKFERSCQKLEKELKELQEKYEALERSGKKEVSHPHLPVSFLILIRNGQQRKRKPLWTLNLLREQFLLNKRR